MSKEFQVNYQIRSKVVQLVTEEGEMRGEVCIREALTLAEEKEMDLIQVTFPDKGGIPVCKIGDYGKMKYHANKKKKNQPHTQLKEIRCNFVTDKHDIEVKHKKILKFLDKHYYVRYVMELKGREKGMLNRAIEKINLQLNDFSKKATWKPVSTTFSKNRIRLVTTLNPL